MTYHSSIRLYSVQSRQRICKAREAYLITEATHFSPLVKVKERKFSIDYFKKMFFYFTIFGSTVSFLPSLSSYKTKSLSPSKSSSKKKSPLVFSTSGLYHITNSFILKLVYKVTICSTQTKKGSAFPNMGQRNIYIYICSFHY